jgi:hypothetical protein
MKQNRRQTRLPRIDIQSVSGYDTFRKRALSVANTTYAYHASKHAARGLLEMLLSFFLHNQICTVCSY